MMLPLSIANGKGHQKSYVVLLPATASYLFFSFISLFWGKRVTLILVNIYSSLYINNNKIKYVFLKSINYMSSSPSHIPLQKGASRFVLWRCWIWWLHELGCKSFGLWFSFRIFIVENPEKKSFFVSFSAFSPYSTPTQVGTENFSKLLSCFIFPGTHAICSI